MGNQTWIIVTNCSLQKTFRILAVVTSQYLKFPSSKFCPKKTLSVKIITKKRFHNRKINFLVSNSTKKEKTALWAQESKKILENFYTE